ncbi:hypothetical protein N9N28_15190 [Rubripirellula amarantea]|nr:hypothetical protein [Rubripirellula amarantea]
MSANNASVDTPQHAVNLSRRIKATKKTPHYSIPDSFANPTAKSVVDGSPSAKFVGQAPPGTAGFKHPKYSIDGEVLSKVVFLNE